MDSSLSVFLKGAALACMAQLAVSEEANADPVVPPTTSLPQVTVEAAPAASGGFEEFAAGKRVIGRARLQASAAGSALEFLKQEPGLTVTADGRIGLMGLPNYTQVLVDGKPPQPGNNLDKLTLDQIERIEIVRAATAELGPFGVAGSINVVMRRVARKPSESLVLTGSGGEGRK
ncbi:MAG: TonB-dependent receptor plug domain-containing protein, partial [Paucibacter sp.]|nr:TonB-dependent receptor plug domain-containing protein [Roseateles sp.]